MKIGLISDTHIPEVTKALPPEVREIFKDVDLILHAGDLYVVSVLDDLERIAPVLAARGDDDYGLRDQRVAEIHKINVDGLTLWLSHTSYTWVIDSQRNPDKERYNKPPDIIVSGHTHRPSMEKRNGILFFSPGSATFPDYQLRLGTVGLLTVEGGQIDAKIVQLGANGK